MAQTLKSKISQMAQAYSINAIIETAKQVQKENATKLNVLDAETSMQLLELGKLIEQWEPLGSKRDQQEAKFYIKQALNQIIDNVIFTKVTGEHINSKMERVNGN